LSPHSLIRGEDYNPEDYDADNRNDAPKVDDQITVPDDPWFDTVKYKGPVTNESRKYFDAVCNGKPSYGK